jgi:hypothetical protein
MDKIGVQPMRVIKGETGLYFKFADGLGRNASPIELFFKPKFIQGPLYASVDNEVQSFTWLEMNILWVGPDEFQDFEGEWKPLRKGTYRTKDGEQMYGYLIGKLYMPMGEFNQNIPAMHQWLAVHCKTLSQYVNNGLLPQVSGVEYMPMQTIFDYMLEQASADETKVENPQIFMQKAMADYQTKVQVMAKAKYTVQHGTPEQDEDQDE